MNNIKNTKNKSMFNTLIILPILSVLIYKRPPIPPLFFGNKDETNESNESNESGDYKDKYLLRSNGLRI
jgi:hypothetical protein